MSDVRIPKGVDEEGWQTIAKYGIQSLSSGRELSHNRNLSTTTETDAHDQQLKGVMTSSLSYVTSYDFFCWLNYVLKRWFEFEFEFEYGLWFQHLSSHKACTATKTFFTMVNLRRQRASSMLDPCPLCRDSVNWPLDQKQRQKPNAGLRRLRALGTRVRVPGQLSHRRGYGYGLWFWLTEQTLKTDRQRQRHWNWNEKRASDSRQLLSQYQYES